MSNAAVEKVVPLLRLPSVLQATGVGRTTLYERIKDGTFTPPIKLGARASACHDNGPWSVADPRPAGGATAVAEAPAMPSANDKLVARIRSLDGTWHRPFTTLELAALQSFIDPEEWFAAGGPADRGERFVLDGPSDQRWREAIGNAVPRKSAKAIGTVMGQTILLAKNGETFVLGSTPIWVRPMVAALAVAREGGAA